MTKKTMTIKVRSGGITIVKPKPVKKDRDTKKVKENDNAKPEKNIADSGKD